MKFLLLVIVGLQLLSNRLISAEEEFDQLASELQLTDMDLVDFCEELSNYSKMSFLNTSTLPDKIKAQNVYGSYLKSQAERMRKFNDVSSDFFRNWTIISKPGDVEMSAADYGELSSQTRWKV
ncbi:uncharacterized protein LOC112905327 isoform X2 [Agrilus planipennis]|uniref:Uncharacterized protein LOC112905327 isoform X2 n=1 Tax=Agrilus planipennis TaxID=224129 RepID=A0A7F5RBC0_AGRPL|nr:uncharacterized protein LOC112905327 isoform X2 [Agrilus planipennis]